MSLVPATPASELSFQNDWSSYLASAGQAIASQVWTISPDEGSMLTNATQSIVSVKGFLRGKDYVLTETITGDGTPPVKEARSFTIRCEVGQ